MEYVRVAAAQLNVTVGDLDGNRDRIVDAMAWGEASGADVLLLPELAVTGYPPEDLLLRSAFVARNRAVVDELASGAGEMVTVVGFVDTVAVSPAPDDAVERSIANAAALLQGGRIRGLYHKVLLPNYGVFDEDRYFLPGTDGDRLWDVGGVAVGVSICEDIWVADGPPTRQGAAGAQLLLNINASPYHRGKGAERVRLIAGQARRSGVPVVYLNLVGGQDELVFDGESLVVEADGSVRFRAPQFSEERFVVDVPVGPRRPGVAATEVGPRRVRTSPPLAPPESVEPLPDDGAVYRALVVGLRDYVTKNGFSEAVIGLSGGIDSALTAAIAADALGPDAVLGVTMPSRHSSAGSVEDSRDLVKRLGIRFEEVPIDGVYARFLEALQPSFAGTAIGVAEENLQARIRGAILMALSNKFGGIVVATGNKSELAVGYATLYGDMAGGYAVLKDVFKTLVYRLAEWRNRDGEVIPRAIIDKPPSAELRPDQLDTDSLPPYEELDPILERYVECDESVATIVAAGHAAAVVEEVAKMVDSNEYKRRQAAPGVRITRKAFGKDRRLPIANRWRG